MVRRAAAVYRSDESARQVYRRLVQEGIAPNRIDVRPASEARGLMPVVRSSVPEGLVIGALLGALAGAAAALSALFVPELSLGLEPGVGSLALGALAGGLVGAFAGALVGLFRVEPQKRRYAELLMKRGTAVSVDTTDPLQVRSATRVFTRTRGVLLHAPESPAGSGPLHRVPG